MEPEPISDIPEVTPAELAGWLAQRPDVLLLDVREPYELPRARLSDERVAYAPLSDLARKHLDGLPENVRQDKAATLVVFCHHGFRSAQVAAWLRELGWSAVYNLAGGIDAYARQVDRQIGTY
jgi:rhodanese-related sulfurtransferase